MKDKFLHKIKSRGFTLVEILVYMAILAMVLTLVFNSLAIIIKSFNNSRLIVYINNSAEVAMERMTREIKNSYEIDTLSSTFDSHPGQLTLNTTDISGTPVSVSFYLDSGRLMVSEDGSAGQPLTSTSVSVTNLVFRSISNSSDSKAVKIEMSIMSEQGDYQRTDNFYNSQILRGSY